MFKEIKTKINFSKEEIEELIDKYVDTYYVNVDIRSNGDLSIWIGTQKNYKGVNHED